MVLWGEAAARELAAQIGFEIPETLSAEDIAQLSRTLEELDE